MDNPLVIQAYDLYSEIYERIQTVPIRWDKKRSRFEVVSNHTKLFPWYLSMFGLFLTGIGCFYIFAERVLSNQSQVVWVTAITMGFVGFMDVFGKCNVTT